MDMQNSPFGTKFCVAF